jgi:membrane protein implicated in regulation of membrane protease activity
VKLQTSAEADAAATAASASLKATLAGGSMLTLGGFTESQIAMFGGLVLGVLGLVLQWYFQSRRDRREQKEHEARMSEFEP